MKPQEDLSKKRINVKGYRDIDIYNIELILNKYHIPYVLIAQNDDGDFYDMENAGDETNFIEPDDFTIEYIETWMPGESHESVTYFEPIRGQTVIAKYGLNKIH